MTRVWTTAASAGAAVCLVCVSGAAGQISGFGDYVTDWRYQQLDLGQGFAPSGNGIRLTTVAGGEQYRSIFNVNRQGINQFVASFSLRATTVPFGSSGQGVTFVLFTSATAPNGTLSGGNYGAYGYSQYAGSSTWNALRGSVGVVMQTPSTSVASAAGVYTNGLIGGVVPSAAPVNFGVDQPIDVRIRYNQPGDLQSFLYVSFTNRTTGATFSPDPTFINIAGVLGAQDAFVGFTSRAESSQFIISDFSFGTIPTPSAAAVLGLGGLMAFRRRRA